MKSEADDAGGVIYCHQAKYHGFHAYDIETGTWGAALTGMPFIGRSGKSKKSKDGGSAVTLGSDMFALKGGNTQEFWRFTLPDGPWAELETMPQLGSTGKKKKVKAGGDITATEGALFALKGNKTLELWQYAPALYALRSTPDARAGVQSGMMRHASGVVRVSPNPLRAGFATLRWDMTGAGHDRIASGQFGSCPKPVSISIFDASGRCILHQASGVGREASSIVLDLRSMPPGVYMLKLTAGSYSTTQKLVIQR